MTQHVTEKDVRDIATYTRIALSDEELPQMTKDLNDIIESLKPITEYDLEGVEPTFHPIGDLSNVMADDVPDTEVRHLPVDVVLKNAGASRGRSFRVPSILGDQGGDR